MVAVLIVSMCLFAAIASVYGVQLRRYYKYGKPEVDDARVRSLENELFGAGQQTGRSMLDVLRESKPCLPSTYAEPIANDFTVWNGKRISPTAVQSGSRLYYMPVNECEEITGFLANGKTISGIKRRAS